MALSSLWVAIAWHVSLWHVCSAAVAFHYTIFVLISMFLLDYKKMFDSLVIGAFGPVSH